MKRVLEPEVMDTLSAAIEYDSMNFEQANRDFVMEAIALSPQAEAVVLDVGTGPGRIPVLMCQMRPKWRAIAIDLAQNMLDVAHSHVEKAGLQSRIQLELADSKQLPYENQQFDLVISNSLVHHLPDPLPFFREVKRVVKPSGGILVRDLVRPADEVALNALVDSTGNEYNQHQTKLFRDSLYAALTIDEVGELISQAGLEKVEVYQSNKYWTLKRNYF